MHQKERSSEKTAPALKYKENIQFVYSDTESEDEDHQPKFKQRKVNTVSDDEEYDLFANKATTSKASSIIEAHSADLKCIYYFILRSILFELQNFQFK